MKRLFALIFACLATSVTASAEPVVIEIFASQNCANCPRAFRNLKTVAKSEDVLPLTWSVDYWDYLADADPMAMPESAERQNAYVERFELRGPYTPQMVFDGALECAGTKKSKVSSWVERRQNTDRADITLTKIEGGFSVSGGLTLPRDVLLVHYLSDYEGEAPNPVVKLERLGQWSGGEITFQTECEHGCAVLVQESGSGEILSAMELS